MYKSYMAILTDKMAEYCRLADILSGVRFDVRGSMPRRLRVWRAGHPSVRPAQRALHE